LLTAISGVRVACNHDEYLDREGCGSKSGIRMLPNFSYSLAQAKNSSLFLAHSRVEDLEVVVTLMKKVARPHRIARHCVLNSILQGANHAGKVILELLPADQWPSPDDKGWTETERMLDWKKVTALQHFYFR
jgi:hypothetical protein